MFTLPPFMLSQISVAVQAASNPYDQYWSNVVFLCPYDVSTTDVKNGVAPTTTTSVDLTGTGKFNAGARMLTVNAGLKYPASENYNFGTAPFTIDCWITVPSKPSNFYIFDIGSNGFHLQYLNGAWLAGSASFVTSIQTGTPFFLELNRNGATLKLFINGSLIASSNVGASVTYGSNVLPLNIGCYGGGGGYSLANAVIDDFRITKGIQRNTSNYTPPTAAAPTSASEGNQVVRLFNFDTNYTDTKIGDVPTVQTGVSILPTGGKFSGGVKFASASSVLRYAASNDYNFGVLPFTIAGWIMRSSTQSAGDYILLFEIGNGGNSSFMLQWSPGVGGWYLYGNGAGLGQFSQAFAVDVFTHFEIVRDGTKLYLFINGTMIMDINVNAGTTYGSYAALSVGCGGSGSYAPINGVMDDFEVIKGYARHTANFTPPTIPYSTIFA